MSHAVSSWPGSPLAQREGFSLECGGREAMKRVLILGGTGEAAKLATQAVRLQGVEVITSLAGRTRRPMTPSGQVRIGGFGGDAGLVDYMRQQRIDLLIDATHPFAAQISWLSGILRGVKFLYYQLLMSTYRRSNILRSESSSAPDF